MRKVHQFAFAYHGGDERDLEELIEKSVRMVMQKILEQQVTDYLGRGYYERSSESRRGYRNGYEGKVHPYGSEFLKNLDSLSPGLKHPAIEMYARGLSTRDIEETLRDRETGKLLLSKDAVSELTGEVWQEYEKFCQRDLSGFDVVHLFVDAVYESLRQLAELKEAILCCWAITSGDHKVLLHLGLGNKESHDSWREFFRRMIGRGLRMPLLVTSDGAPGLIKAIAECFPESKRQRCTVHKLRNIRNKLPQDVIDELYPRIRSVFYQTDAEIAKLYAGKIIGISKSIPWRSNVCRRISKPVFDIWGILPDITSTS